eukprot:5187357-Prymnesium_polylepis.1
MPTFTARARTTATAGAQEGTVPHRDKPARIPRPLREYKCASCSCAQWSVSPPWWPGGHALQPSPSQM